MIIIRAYLFIGMEFVCNVQNGVQYGKEMRIVIVITLTSCPPKLRGDLSKWLCEINTGVYVGN